MLDCLFIEGLPGSGKTTFSRRLEEVLSADDIRVKRYSEGDLHPLDLAWIAIMNEKDYRFYLEKYHDLADKIKAHTIKEDGNYLVAYMKIPLENHHQNFDADFGAFEIYRTKDIDAFKKMHLKRWLRFAQTRDPNTLYIFECVFLQNHINELLLNFNLTETEIHVYLNALLSTLKPMQSILYYIEQADVENRIAFVSEQRKTNNKALFKDWIDLVIAYIAKQKNAQKMGYTGYEGILAYFKRRQAVEVKLLPHLKTNTHTVRLTDDYDIPFQEITNHIKNTFTLDDKRRN